MTTSHQVQIRVRLALSCVTCDMPASRKVVGFLGHNATQECNKILIFGLEKNVIFQDLSEKTGLCEMKSVTEEMFTESSKKSGVRAKESELAILFCSD